jgi:hypothetical protein
MYKWRKLALRHTDVGLGVLYLEAQAPGMELGGCFERKSLMDEEGEV